MVKAYILAKVETGADKEVLREIKSIPEVKKVSMTYGPFDLAIEATFETIEDLFRPLMFVIVIQLGSTSY